MRKFGLLAALSSLFVGAFAMTALASPTPSEQVGTALGSAAEGIFETVLDVATTVLPYAAVLAGLFIGWSIVRRFISG